MIMLDIDDTLVNYSLAERIASRQFGVQFSSEIPDYDAETFPGIWNLNMRKYYQEFLSGRISYLDQRRFRIRSIFQNTGIEDSQADEIYSAYKSL